MVCLLYYLDVEVALGHSLAAEELETFPGTGDAPIADMNSTTAMNNQDIVSSTPQQLEPSTESTADIVSAEDMHAPRAVTSATLVSGSSASLHPGPFQITACEVVPVHEIHVPETVTTREDPIMSSAQSDPSNAMTSAATVDGTQESSKGSNEDSGLKLSSS